MNAAPPEQRKSGTLTIGLLGTGEMARARAKCLTRIPDTKPLAVASHTTKNAHGLAIVYGIQSIFASHRDLLTSGMDAVIVATPDDTHHEIVKDTFEADKDVLVECPMALQSEHAEEIVRLAEEREAIVEVGFDSRFLPLHGELHEAVRAGQVGQPLWCSTKLLYPMALEPGKWYWRQESTRGMIASWLVERLTCSGGCVALG